MQAHDVARGEERVAVDEGHALLVGIIRAGAVQANVNPLYTPRELEHQLNDAGAQTIVVYGGVSGTVAEVIAQSHLATYVVSGESLSELAHDLEIAGVALMRDLEVLQGIL